MNIDRLSIEYTLIIYKILYFFFNLKNEKNKIYMVLKYAGRAGNEYPVEIYEDIYRKIKMPKKINIPMVNIKYFQLE